MDPSDAIVNAIMADSASGPAFASSSGAPTVNARQSKMSEYFPRRRKGLTKRKRKIERRAARLKASLQPQASSDTNLPILPPDILREVSKHLVKYDNQVRKKQKLDIKDIEKELDESQALYNKLRFEQLGNMGQCKRLIRTYKNQLPYETDDERKKIHEQCIAQEKSELRELKDEFEEAYATHLGQMARNYGRYLRRLDDIKNFKNVTAYESGEDD